jgi:hypothetical protein
MKYRLVFNIFDIFIGCTNYEYEQLLLWESILKKN